MRHFLLQKFSTTGKDTMTSLSLPALTLIGVPATKPSKDSQWAISDGFGNVQLVVLVWEINSSIGATRNIPTVLYARPLMKKYLTYFIAQTDLQLHSLNSASLTICLTHLSLLKQNPFYLLPFLTFYFHGDKQSPFSP